MYKRVISLNQFTARMPEVDYKRMYDQVVFEVFTTFSHLNKEFHYCMNKDTNAEIIFYYGSDGNYNEVTGYDCEYRMYLSLLHHRYESIVASVSSPYYKPKPMDKLQRANIVLNSTLEKMCDMLDYHPDFGGFYAEAKNHFNTLANGNVDAD